MLSKQVGLSHSGLPEKHDDPDIDGDRFGGTDAVDRPLLQGAQEFGLGSQVEVAYFVEKQGAAIGRLEFAYAPLHPGSDPPFDAEKFRFDELVGQGGAVESDKRPICPRAVVM